MVAMTQTLTQHTVDELRARFRGPVVSAGDADYEEVRKYGLTIDHLGSAELVTVDGEVLEVSANRNPELFWAIRGGGGNFGIVTAFEFDLVPLGPEVYGGIVLYPAEQASNVLRQYR